MKKLPWDYRDDKIEVILTGRAFNFIELKKEEDDYTFRSVLSKAQVYARMSPDDKALLVKSMQNYLLD